MFRQRIQNFTQIIGGITIVMLAVYGVLAIFGFNGTILASAETAAAISGAPTVMNYQGTLKDSNSDPLHGEYNMTFRIYDDPTGGTVKWSETHINVPVVQGDFSVLLGDTTPLTADLFSNTQRYIGVTVADYGELSPRGRIASVAYALTADRALVADHATGLSSPTNPTKDWVTVRDNGFTRVPTGLSVGPFYHTVGSVGKVTIAGENASFMFIDQNLTEKPDDWQPGDMYSWSNTDRTAKLSTGGSGGNGMLSITSEGKVGIGTTSPDQKLSVVGRARAAYDADETEYIEIGHGGSNGFINTVGDGNLDFRHETVTKMSLTDAGDLHVTGDLNVDGDISGNLSTIHGELYEDVSTSGLTSRSLAPVEDHMCFLVKVDVYEVDDEFGRCDIYEVDDYWHLFATVTASTDARAICRAYCIGW